MQNCFASAASSQGLGCKLCLHGLSHSPAQLFCPLALGAEPHSALLLSGSCLIVVGAGNPEAQTSLEHQVRLSHPHPYLFSTSPAVFQYFCDLKPKVGQRQAAPGQYLSWVSISRGKSCSPSWGKSCSPSRGKSCSLPNEVVSFSQDLPQRSAVGIDLAPCMWHTDSAGRRLWWGCFGSGTCSASSGKLPAGAALGCWDGSWAVCYPP